MTEPYINEYTLSNSQGTVVHVNNEDRRTDNQLGTGVYVGGVVTVNALDNTKFDISAGRGIVVDNYTDPEYARVVRVQWEAKIGVSATYRTTNLTSYISIAQNAEVIQAATKPQPTERRDHISLALLVHTDLATIQAIDNRPIPGYDLAHMLIDFCDSIGVINKSGNQFSANGANLKVNKSSGESYFPGANYTVDGKNPNLRILPVQTAPFMFRSYRNGSGGWAPPVVSDLVDVAYYDNGTGTLAAVPANNPFSIFRFWVSIPRGDVIIAYSQNVYKSMAAAEAVINSFPFIQNPVLNDQSFRGYLIVKRDCVSLANTAKAKFIAAGKVGAGGAVGASTATTDLQGAYDNSAATEIITNSIQGAVTFEDGTNVSTAHVLSIKNFAMVQKAYINASGQYSGGVIGGVTASRPGSPSLYHMYFDTTLGIPIWHNGTNWVNHAGSTV